MTEQILYSEDREIFGMMVRDAISHPEKYLEGFDQDSRRLELEADFGTLVYPFRHLSASDIVRWITPDIQKDPEIPSPIDYWRLFILNFQDEILYSKFHLAIDPMHEETTIKLFR